LVCFGFAVAILVPIAAGQETSPFQQPPISVPEGYTFELAAAPPLVTHPIMAGFDERGRLYVAETAGHNMQRAELEEKLPNFVTRLEDADGDGKFDKRTTFADKLTFPQGALWHDGWLYVASSGAIWRFADKDDDGVAEVREKIVSSFGYTGNAADVHGCFLGPDGRIHWCEGRHGHEITDSAGQVISKGKAARIFSCRTDGSDVRVHCGGGMDNPVEIDWTEEGEMLGTVNIFYHKRGDCLVHWMHGGLYPRHDQPAVLAEFKKTGEPLDAVHDYGHVAVSGCCRLRGAGVSPARAVGNALRGVPSPLSPGGRGAGGEGAAVAEHPHPNPLPKGEGTNTPAATFLVTHFNTHKVVTTTLHRDGSTFRAETSDFFQAASDDFHPTDVLEDADGSLLVIDTGGWFRIGCPTSQIAKPNILGAIYRVRRTDAAKIEDPRGLAIDWDKLEAAPLINLLADERPAVRERAIQTLARQGDAAVPYLSRALAHKNIAIRRNAVWALTRIGTPKAQGSVRLLGLADKDPAVLAAAIYSAGATADAAAAEDLQQLLTSADAPPHLRREAATALGKIGAPEAVPAILSALHQDSDRVLEHALIYALIEIADPASTEGLADDSPAVRRAALIALDQMEGGNLTRDQVAALLDTTDQPLLTAALDVISRHQGWSSELVELASKLLAKNELSESEQSLLSGSLTGLAKDENVQRLVSNTLGRPDIHVGTRLLLLDVIGRSDVKPLPESWIELLKTTLLTGSDLAVEAAIPVAGSAAEVAIDERLMTIARDPKRPSATRLKALSALAGRQEAWAAADFDFLMRSLAEGSPLDRLIAGRLLSSSDLSDSQLSQLVNVLRRTDLEQVAFVSGHSSSSQLVKKLAEAGIDIASLNSQNGAEQLTKLESIQSQLPTGGIPSGREIFFGRKAACSACHRVGSEGGKIGPDLSKVGERRNERDLLEAIVFPSASIARGFESHAILTTDGVNLTGLVVRETPESLFLRTNDQREVRLKRADVETMKPSTTSIMPAGLEKTISRQELADLLAYLRSLK
jgi:putative heme-binding domain-containing protein